MDFVIDKQSIWNANSTYTHLVFDYFNNNLDDSEKNNFFEYINSEYNSNIKRIEEIRMLDKEPHHIYYAMTRLMAYIFKLDLEKNTWVKIGEMSKGGPTLCLHFQTPYLTVNKMEILCDYLKNRFTEKNSGGTPYNFVEIHNGANGFYFYVKSEDILKYFIGIIL